MVTLKPKLSLVHARVTLPAAVAQQAVEDAAMDLAARRAARELRPRSGPQPRCEACCRFKSNPHLPCSCGYAPGQGYAA